jgi:hypothetical protein
VYAFIQDKVVVVYENVHARQTWVFHPDPAKSRRATYPADKTDIPELDIHTTVYIYDCKAGVEGPNEPVQCAAKKAVFSSANTGTHKQTMRDLLCLCYITPSQDELFRAAEIFDRRDVNVRRSFSKYGGSMRLLFNMPEDHAAVYMSNFCDAVNTGNIDKLISVAVESNITHADSVPRALFSTFLKPGALEQVKQDENGDDIQPTRDTEMAALTQAYVSTNVVWRIATDDIFNKLRLRASDSIEEFLARFVAASKNNPVVGVTRGNSLQILAPKRLANGGEFRVRKLSNSGQEMVSKLTLSKRALVWRNYDRVEEVLLRCTDPTVFYAMNGKLPAFDAYVPPNVFFQMTSVSAPRHNVVFDAAALICAHCRAKKLPAIFIFAVPDDLFPLWKRLQSFACGRVQASYDKLSMQQKTKVNGFVQYVLEVPVDAWVLEAEERRAAAENAGNL